jgi:hypothetical protein
MGPKPTRTLAIVVGAVAILGSVCQAAAQNFPSDPLAVRMPDDAVKADVEVIVAAAARLGVPFGFEAVDALSEQISTPFKHGPKGTRLGRETAIGRASRLGGKSRLTRLSGKRSPTLDIRGTTLRQALDAVVAKDRRYEWRYIDGVVVVRPASAWRDPGHPLLRTVSEGTSLFDQLNALARIEDTQWSLRSEVSTVLLDQGRAVTIAEPALKVVGPGGFRAIPLSQP